MKKQIIFTVLVLIAFFIDVQNKQDLKTIYNNSKKFYENLDHNKMQSNLLFNYGFVFLQDLENIKDNKQFIADTSKWWSIYKSVQNSSLNNKKQS